MKNQLTDQVKLLQKAVIIVDGEFLILKRSSNSHTRANKWDLPGGNSEWPSNFTKTIQSNIVDPHLADLLREVLEETGIKLELSQLSCQPVYLSTYFEFDKQLYSIITGWRVILPAKPAIKISSEHTQFDWITKEQFDQYDFGFAGKPEGFIRQSVMCSFSIK